MPATLGKTPFRYSGNNGEAQVVAYPEKATSTFAYGDFVTLTSGQIDLAGSDPSSILGIALEAKSGTTGTLIPVLIPRADDIFFAMMYVDDTPANNYATRATHVGGEYGILKQAAGVWGVDTAETTAKIVKVVGMGCDLFPAEMADGDAYGLFQAKFLIDILESGYDTKA